MDDIVDRLEACIFQQTLGGHNCFTPTVLVRQAAAEIRTLRAKLAEAEGEQAKIVAWLRGLHWTHRDYDEAQRFADAIEAGQHMEVSNG